jgi:hemerythrin
MPFMAIQWELTMSVGIEKIDKQHQYFVSLLNQLYEAIEKKSIKNDLAKLIKQLDKYAHTHFETEEKILNKYNYPYLEEHIKEHNNLLTQLESFEAVFPKEPLKYAFDLADFLENWLVEHLEIQDGKYAKYFRENGITE